MSGETVTQVLEMLQANEQKDLLRFVTAGSVDDGKSTMIGRLLYESKGIDEDQLDAVRSATARKGATGDGIDLALVTDGLRAEREQGITIDVAYRYFSTPKRKFIIADTPGHEQYTRNMATGASTASLAIILIDASQGVLPQSRRHAFIASLLGIPHIAVAVNKMDLVDYDRGVYERIVEEFTEFSTRLELRDVTFIPISALHGDNVVSRSDRMPWYRGTTLLNHLETVHIASDRNLIDLRFPVQYVSRPDSEFRGYMGTVASGIVRRGDELMVLPSGLKSTVREVLSPQGAVDEARAGMPVTLTLADEIDISRGDMLVHVHNVPHVGRRLDAMLVWMSSEPLDPSGQYMVKHSTRLVSGQVVDLRYRIDVNTLRRHPAGKLELNEIGRCLIELARPVPHDPYTRNRQTGAFILIDRITHNTVAAGMILDREPNELQVEPARRVGEARSRNVRSRAGEVTEQQRAERLGQQPATIWLTGLTGSGKTTIAFELERRLFADGLLPQVLDGENLRLGLNRDLAFGADDRAENIRRAGEVARLANQAGLICICSLLSPYRSDRELVARRIGPERFIEVYLSAPLDVCRQRAPEVYAKAESGEVPMFSGVSAPYEPPSGPALSLPTHELDVGECVERILSLLRERGIVPA